jgi:hypothetical protein
MFEKRIGVHGKHNDVLEKKLSVSAHLVQNSASIEVPSVEAVILLLPLVCQSDNTTVDERRG